MKILVINTVRFKLNGISAVIMNYYKAIDKEDLNMEFIAIDEPIDEYKKIFKEFDLKYYVIYRKNVIHYIRKLIRIVKEGKYDIVHIHGNSSTMVLELFACWCGGVKVRIAHSHNTTTTHPMIHKLMYPFFILLCTERFACGEEAGKWLFRKKSFVEIKNGIDLKKYQYDENIRQEYRTKINAKNRMVIGHVGNFVEQKNHTFLLDVFAELIRKNEDCLLLLISDGYLLDAMQEKAVNLGIEKNVLFLGKTTDVEKYLQAMDVFVLPSLYEGLPVVLVEAQAAGLPCVVADNVDRNVDLTNSISFLTIDNVTTWVKALVDKKNSLNKINREMLSKQWREIIAEKGYSIHDNAQILKNLYRANINKSKK